METHSPDTAVVLHQQDRPDAYALIMRAVSDPACDPEKLGKLLAIKTEWDREESRKAFSAAMAGFASECPIVAKLDPGDKAKYAKIDRIEREIRPLKRKYGIFISWTESTLSADGGMIHMRGLLCHVGGHSVQVAFDMPFPEAIISREGKRVGNASQSMGSGMSYCQRYAEGAILHVVCGVDDDGAGGHRSPPASREALANVRAALAANGRDEAKACAYLKLRTLDDATADDLIKLATTMAKPAKPAAGASDRAVAHVPTRAESLAVIANAKAIPRAAALKSRDLTPENYETGSDIILAEVAQILVKGDA